MNEKHATDKFSDVAAMLPISFVIHLHETVHLKFVCSNLKISKMHLTLLITITSHPIASRGPNTLEGNQCSAQAWY